MSTLEFTLLNIPNENAQTKDNHDRHTHGIWLVFDIVYFEYFIVYCARYGHTKQAPAGKES